MPGDPSSAGWPNDGGDGGRNHPDGDGHDAATKCLLRRQTESQRDFVHQRRLAGAGRFLVGVGV